MRRGCFAPASLLVVWLTASAAWSQSAKTAVEPQTKPQHEHSTASEANLKFDILESQLQTLRKKMQQRAKRRAEQTKEWNEHYETVKRQIEAWDDFVDAYRVE